MVGLDLAAPVGAWAESETWDGFAIGGGELNFAPGIDNQLTGHGWVGFDTVGLGIVGRGDLRVFWNTTKLHVGVERISFAKDKLAFFAFVEGEALISQLLNDYFVRGRRISEFGIEARIGCNYWKIDVPSEEWEGHRVFPRITGIAVGLHLGLDLRSDVRPWGLVGDGHNDPGKVIYVISQRLRGGWKLGRFVWLQLDQWGNYG